MCGIAVSAQVQRPAIGQGLCDFRATNLAQTFAPTSGSRGVFHVRRLIFIAMLFRVDGLPFNFSEQSFERSALLKRSGAAEGGDDQVVDIPLSLEHVQAWDSQQLYGRHVPANELLGIIKVRPGCREAAEAVHAQYPSLCRELAADVWCGYVWPV